MSDWRPRYASSETDMSNWRPTCLIGDPLETHWRPRPASLETHLKPTCPIGHQHTCLIGDTLETDIPNQKPTRDQNAGLESPYIFQYI